MIPSAPNRRPLMPRQPVRLAVPLLLSGLLLPGLAGAQTAAPGAAAGETAPPAVTLPAPAQGGSAASGESATPAPEASAPTTDAPAADTPAVEATTPATSTEAATDGTPPATADATAPEAAADAAASATPTTEPTAASCPALGVIDAQQAQIDKVLGLAKDGLVPDQAVTTLYANLARDADAAMKDTPFDAACYRAIGSRADQLDEADGPDRNEARLLHDRVTAAVRRQCEAVTDAAGLTACVTDVTDGLGHGFTAQTVTAMMSALPLRDITLTDEESRAFLTLLKEKAEAGAIPDGQRADATRKLLGL
ncbi:hypothetical protein [Paracoccus sanguinis]|uniref:hypothetical protein n=1 Tax=Paracoccus sanguinis TaxID=1545044 RepID=UPI00051FDA9D|nr:hypothetical protein [Paracoccus sanguinis]KGJ13571.1 hypothetical protein IX54_11220 [Paracoccus sanguinis]